jgi:surfeit locus 1 family protein
MTRRMILPLIFGLLGTAILLALGVWQVQRLHWKEEVLGVMAARLGGAPADLPAAADPARDQYLPVAAEGRFTGPEIHVLTSRPPMGPGYRVVQAFETEGRRILVDRGFIPQPDRDRPRGAGPVRLTGNLHWPDETDPRFTPAPDRAANIWFAREVGAMAAELGTEPMLLVVRQTSAPSREVWPWPVDVAGIRNAHLQYALTWFMLAAVWAGLTLWLLWRIRRGTV